MSVVTIQPPAVVYREEQNFDWRVYAALALVQFCAGVALAWLYKSGWNPLDGGSLKGLSVSLLALGGLTFPVLLAIGLLRMTTEVTPSDVRVWFGWIPTYRRFVPILSVTRIEVVTYRPIRDCGGWGIRVGRDGERVLNARGNRGVRLDLADGSRLLVGSQRPDELALMIERALRPGA